MKDVQNQSRRKIKSLKDLRRYIYKDKPFYEQISLSDFYLYNWSIETIFNIAKNVADNLLSNNKEPLLKRIRRSIISLASIGMVAFIFMKTYLLRDIFRAGRYKLLTLTGVLIGASPGIFGIVNLLYRYIQHSTALRDNTDNLSDITDKLKLIKAQREAESDSNKKKLFNFILFIGSIALSVIPFLFAKSKSLSWLLQMLDKFYKAIRSIVAKLKIHLKLSIRYNSDKLANLALEFQTYLSSYADRLVQGLLIGALISIGLAAIVFTVELVHLKSIDSVLEFTKQLLSDNIVTYGIQFAILFLVFLYQEFKGKKVKDKAIKIRGKPLALSVPVKIDLDDFYSSINALRLTKYRSLSYIGTVDSIHSEYLETLEQNLKRAKDIFESIANTKTEIYVILTREPILNAFVIPGNVESVYILLGTDILPFVNEITVKEWVALLLHEHAHIIFHIRNHLLETIVAFFALNDVIWSFFKTLYRNTFNNLTFELLLAVSKYQDLVNILRLLEIEADAYVISKGYGEHLVNLFKKLGIQYDVYDESVIDTHDIGALRIKEIEEAVKLFEQRKKEQKHILNKRNSLLVIT